MRNILFALIMLSSVASKAQSMFHFTDSAKMTSFTAHYEVAFPVLTGTKQFMDAYHLWLAADLNNGDKTYSFKSNGMDYKKMAKFYRDTFFSQAEDVGYGYGWESKINLLEDNSAFVTLEEAGYDYRGGAHGLSTDCGVTISRDGTVMKWDDWFAQKAPLSRMIADAVTKQYFQGDGTHVNNFLQDENTTISMMPLPNMAPWLKGDNLVFMYAPYEMGAYALGMPRCEIPISRLYPYMTTKAKMLIKNSEGKRKSSKKLKVIKIISSLDYLSASQGNTYSPMNMFDGDKSTCWAHRIKNDSEINGDKPFGLNLQMNYSRIDKIVIYNGYSKNQSVYQNNSRPKRIYFANKVPKDSDDYTCRFLTYDLQDKMQPQTLIVLNSTLEKSSCLFLGIEEIYKGAKWNDLCISEIEIWGVE